MHIASKVTLILGAILLAIGGIGLVAGIGNVADSGAETKSFASSQSSGSFSIPTNGSWTVEVYVIHPVDCDSLQLSITDSTGYEIVSDDDYCILMSENEGSMGSPSPGTEEYYTAFGGASDMEYSYTSNVDLNIRGEDCDAECMEAIAGGILSTLGGFGSICCAIPLLVLGIILAFVLDDPVQNVMMPAGQMPTGQVGYQAPVMGQAPVSQNMNQVPVMGQAPVGQPMQHMGAPQAQITPPLTQQPAQPVEPAQSPWDNIQPPQ